MTIKRLGDATTIADAVIHGDTVYLAGQVAEDPTPASVYDQTKKILAQIDAVLAEAGTDKTKISKNQYLAGRHLDLRRDEQGLERVGAQGPGPGARHRRGQAGFAAVEGRDHGDRGALIRGSCTLQRG